MIEIKSFFSDWHVVDKGTAKRFVKNFISTITTMRGPKLFDYINKHRLRGITAEELLSEEK